MTDESVCRGLHHGSRTLRDRCLRVPPDTEDGSSPSERAVPGVAGSEDKKNARSLRDVGAYDAGPALWAPYVHFGV